MLLEKAIRMTEIIDESEALLQMFDMVLEKMNEDSAENIHLSLRIIYNLLLALEEHQKD